jgi:calcium/calmodulin-dependent protein kinase I
MKEIDILRKMEHENVVRVYDVYENDGYLYLVCDYLAGGELSLLIGGYANY